jgi:hypothetical protein
MICKLGAVKYARRDQADISVFHRIQIFPDLIGQAAAQKKIDLVIIMSVHGYIRHVLIFIIVYFIIRRLHFLSGIKFRMIVFGHNLFLSERTLSVPGFSRIHFGKSLLVYPPTAIFAMFTTRFVI